MPICDAAAIHVSRVLSIFNETPFGDLLVSFYVFFNTITFEPFHIKRVSVDLCRIFRVNDMLVSNWLAMLHRVSHRLVGGVVSLL